MTRCSVGATYTVAFSFAVLCQLFTLSVICYFDHAVDRPLEARFFARGSRVDRCRVMESRIDFICI